MDGLFNKEGLTGMLEAVDTKGIDMISPFLGALMDRVSDESNTRPITTMFTDYVDIKSAVLRY